MYECPNCGGNLKFEISSQQLACGFCGTHIDPYEIKKETDAVEQEYYEATVFTCPQCAGEILSADNEAAAFCSFCGASTILSSRIAKEKRPKYIIPFKVTKEECKNAYAKKMRKAFFAPKELRDPKYIDSFRGIYMPYWTYQLTQQGRYNFAGKNSHRKGDYIITDHFDLLGSVNAYYLGYARDASSTFYDNISVPLGPYHVKDMVNFEPTFLSGFYADTADVDAQVYLDDVTELANQSTFDKITELPAFRDYDIDSESNRNSLERRISTDCKSADSTMYPVWFLSYRNGNRVAYATVNGQTGKVVADMPVDLKKYIGCSLLLAVLLFFLLNRFFTLKPAVLLGVSCLLAIISAYIYKRELKKIKIKENNEDDEGFQKRQGMLHKGQQMARQVSGKSEQEARSEKVKKAKKKSIMGKAGYPIIVMICWGITILYTIGVTWGNPFWHVIGSSPIWIAAVVGICIICGKGISEAAKMQKTSWLGFLLSMITVVLGSLIGMFSPVSDMWYYGGAFLILIAVLFNMIDILKNYNRLAMRRLPQFDKQGGDHRG